MRMRSVLRAMAAKPWAIEPSRLEVLCEVVLMHAESGRPIAQLEAELPQQSEPRRRGNTAIIPLVGTLAPRMGAMEAMSGGTTLDAFRQNFRDAVATTSIDAVILDVDSPGGYIDGVTETAHVIREGAKKKPVIAVANAFMASAAYWIGAAASEVDVTPSGSVGSVGVVAVHVDTSEADKADGVKYNIISAGPYKTEGNSLEPLTDEARGEMQRHVDSAYAMFLSDLRTFRDGRRKAVREDFGGGRMFMAKDAVALGMADRVATLDQVVERFAAQRIRRARAAL